MSLVSLVKIGESKKGRLKRAVIESLNLIDFHFRKNVDNVVIKPNMCYYWDYTTGQTTNPDFVAALINVLREKVPSDPSISIVESDASAMKCKYAFKVLGYEKMAERHRVQLVNLSEKDFEIVKVKVNDENFSLRLPYLLRDADLLINVPKIKYMSGVKITCSLKNVYGCNPFPRKYLYHAKLDQTIVALNKIIKFDLSILDADYVSGISPRHLGLAMASLDPVALDAVAANIAGINPRSIRHLTLAEREGIGIRSYILRGVNIDYFKSRYPRKTTTWKTRELVNQLIQISGLGKFLEP